jgi:hypothetical protein
MSSVVSVNGVERSVLSSIDARPSYLTGILRCFPGIRIETAVSGQPHISPSTATISNVWGSVSVPPSHLHSVVRKHRV